jgi:hypothetical protein
LNPFLGIRKGAGAAGPAARRAVSFFLPAEVGRDGGRSLRPVGDEPATAAARPPPWTTGFGETDNLLALMFDACEPKSR